MWQFLFELLGMLGHGLHQIPELTCLILSLCMLKILHRTDSSPAAVPPPPPPPGPPPGQPPQVFVYINDRGDIMRPGVPALPEPPAAPEPPGLPEPPEIVCVHDRVISRSKEGHCFCQGGGCFGRSLCVSDAAEVSVYSARLKGNLFSGIFRSFCSSSPNVLLSHPPDK